MSNFRLFRHAVLMLIENLSTALRLSAFPFFVLLVATIVFAAAVGEEPATSLIPLAFLAVPFLIISFLVVFVWVAVGWHGFVA